jgi:membrane protein implicated in regulation of membrane protease activity
MVDLLGWQNLLFLVPLAVGVLLALGTALGLGSEGADSPLEAGAVPVGVLGMVGALLFGGLGMVLNATLAPPLREPVLYGPLSLLLSAVASVLLTRRCARLLARLMPSAETYRVSREDLVGRSGRLVLPASPEGGLAQVRDHEGNVHQVRVRTLAGRLEKGSEVVVVEHHAPDHTYVVAALED